MKYDYPWLNSKGVFPSHKNISTIRHKGYASNMFAFSFYGAMGTKLISFVLMVTTSCLLSSALCVVPWSVVGKLVKGERVSENHKVGGKWGACGYHDSLTLCFKPYNHQKPFILVSFKATVNINTRIASNPFIPSDGGQEWTKNHHLCHQRRS